MDERPAEAWKRFRSAPNEADFAVVYEATHRLVWTICVRVLAEEADARDAFQATYTRVLAERPATDDPVGLVGRLAGLEADALRKRRARLARREVASVESHDAESGGGGPASKLEAEQLRTLLLRETARLEEELRVPLQLHFLDGLSQREVASAIGVSPYTVNTRIRRALERLRPLLRRAGIERVEDALPALLPLATLLFPPADVRAADVFVAARGAAPAAATAGGGAAVVLTSWKVAAVLVVAAIFIAGTALRSRGSAAASEGETRPVALAEAPKPSAATAEPTPAAAAPTPLPAATPTPLPATPPPAGAGSIRGVLRNRNNGSTLAGISIRLFKAHPGLHGQTAVMNTPGPIATTTTDADGAFSFASLASADYVLYVDSETWRLLDDKLDQFEEFAVKSDGPPVEVELLATPASFVSGVVFDVATRAPLAGAWVRSMSGAAGSAKMGPSSVSNGYESETLSGPDGRYTLPVFGETVNTSVNGTNGRTRSLRLSFGKDGYTSLHKLYPPGAVQRVFGLHLNDRIREVELDLYLAPATECRILIEEPGRGPVGGAQVHIAYPGGQSHREELADATADARGMATMRFSPDTTMTLTVNADGYVQATKKFYFSRSDAGAPVRVEMVSTGGRRLRFQVVMPDGRPYCCGTFEVFRLEPGRPFPRRLPISWKDYQQGSFEVEGFDPAEIAAGEWRLRFAEVGYEPMERALTEEDMTAGEPRRIVVTPLKANRHFFGTIRDDNGDPLPGATVFVPESKLETTTDAAGRYEIDIYPDSSPLAVSHPDLGVTAFRTLREGEANDLDWKDANAIVEVHFFAAGSRPRGGLLHRHRRGRQPARHPPSDHPQRRVRGAGHRSHGHPLPGYDAWELGLSRGDPCAGGKNTLPPRRDDNSRGPHLRRGGRPAPVPSARFLTPCIFP